MHCDLLCPGKFVKRMNRFVAQVLVNDDLELAHVPITSHLTELQSEGNPIIRQGSQNPLRKS